MCLLSFWLSVSSAHRYFSLDVILFPKIKQSYCPSWQILIFKAQLSIVYFFAGLAKVNPDWLLRAQPLATWLPGKYYLPVLGGIMHLKQTAYFFSWAGCLYDMSIWIFLLISKTRPLAYIAVVVFHVLTAILFPRIGMFPFIMISSTIIFFRSEWHERILTKVQTFIGKIVVKRSRNDEIGNEQSIPNLSPMSARHYIVSFFICTYVLVQVLLPFRYLQFPGNLFWHEKGFRFSWRVMLIEKAGYTVFILRDPKKEVQREVRAKDYLTDFQAQQMSTQPDMIWQFAKLIGDEFTTQNGYMPQVFVKSWLSLNGRRSQAFTNDAIDVYRLKSPYENSQWILPFVND